MEVSKSCYGLDFLLCLLLIIWAWISLKEYVDWCAIFSLVFMLDGLNHVRLMCCGLNVHVNIHVIIVNVMSLFYVIIMLESFLNIHVNIHIIIVNVVLLLMFMLLFIYMLLLCKCLCCGVIIYIICYSLIYFVYWIYRKIAKKGKCYEYVLLFHFVIWYELINFHSHFLQSMLKYKLCIFLSIST